MTPDRHVLVCDRILTPVEVLAPAWISWSGTTVTGIGEGYPAGPVDFDLRGRTVVPGFIDTHVHGGGGGSFADGAVSALRAVEFHRRHGTTTIVASLVTDALPRLLRAVDELRDLVVDGTLAGVHLEGPWLCPGHRGAHAMEWLREPRMEDVREVLRAGADALTSITLAPERPGGLDAVRAIADAGVRAAVGHTSATYDETVAALDGGARIGTHVFNAMRAVHHRAPGPAVALMERDDAFVEAVADGHHVHPAMLRQLEVNPARLVLVSDAMSAAGLPDGPYALGDVPVDVCDGLPRIAGTQTLAGSALTLDRAVRNCVELAGIGLQEAVTAATATPAALLGRTDIGALAVGNRADLVVLDRRLEVEAVLSRGRWGPAHPTATPDQRLRHTERGSNA